MLCATQNPAQSPFQKKLGTQGASLAMGIVA